MVICFGREKVQMLQEFFMLGQDLPLPIANVLAQFEGAFARDIPFWKKVRDDIIKPVHAFLVKKFSDVEPRPTTSKPMIKALRRWKVWQLLKFAELLRPS